LLDIIAKTIAQKSAAVVRGSHFTSIQSGSSSSQCFNAGCIESYQCPVGKIAKIKGQFSITAFGAQTLVFLNQFDNVTGFNVKIAVITIVASGGGFMTVNFETELNSDQDFNVRGNAAGLGAVGDVVMSITELPR